MLPSVNPVELATHALVIAIVIFAGFLLAAIVGSFVGFDVLAETLEWTGMVTAVLYAFRQA